MISYALAVVIGILGMMLFSTRKAAKDEISFDKKSQASADQTTQDENKAQAIMKTADELVKEYHEEARDYSAGKSDTTTKPGK